MFNPITKTARYLRREYPFKTSFTAVMTGIGLGISAILLAAPGAPLLMPLLMPVGLGLFSLGFISVAGGEHDRPPSNSATVNGVKLVGDVKDVASIHMTQELINSCTEKLKHQAELPRRVQKKIAAHLADIQPRLERLRFLDNHGKPTTFSFMRQIYDAAGELVGQPVGVSTTLALPAPLLALPAPAEQPTTLPQVARPSEEFATLAKKVEDVSGRVERLENPPVVKLDKPALHK